VRPPWGCIDELILQPGDLPQIEVGLLLRVEHALQIAEFPHRERRALGFLLGQADLFRRELHQVLAAAFIQLVDQVFSHLQELAVDHQCVVRIECTDQDSADGRHRVDVHLYAPLVVLVQRLEAVVEINPRESGEEVASRVAVDGAQIQSLIKLPQGIAGEHVIPNRVGIILGRCKPHAFHEFPQARGGLALWAAHHELGLGHEHIRGDEPVIDHGQHGRDEHGNGE
jgi:hypothetical protein